MDVLFLKSSHKYFITLELVTYNVYPEMGWFQFTHFSTTERVVNLKFKIQLFNVLIVFGISASFPKAADFQTDT